MAEIDHLSYSSIALYLACPAAWRYRYIEKVTVPSAPTLAFGSAIHGTIEKLLRQRVAGQNNALVAVWQEQWELAVKQHSIAWDTETPERLAQQGLKLLEYVEVAQAIHDLEPLVEAGEPIIEKYVELRVPGVPLPIIGYIDVVTADGVPLDIKTASKAWTPEQAEKELQPLFYLAAMNQLGWTRNVSYRFRHLVLVKTQPPRVQLIETQRRAADLFWLASLIGHVWRGIAQEVFPCNPIGWRCSPRWCDYWSHCRG